MTSADSIRRLLMRPLLWILIYGGLIAYGVYALFHIPVEVLPRFDFPQISVIVHQPGATAAELEMLIARPLEGEILSLPNLIEVRSLIGHETVQTSVRFAQGTNPQLDLQTVNSAIDRARGQLPATVRIYAEVMGNAINEVADYTMQIPAKIAPMAALRAVRARVVPALRGLPGVQRVEAYGTGDEALWVQPQLEAMRRYQVESTAIVQAIKQHVQLSPGGYQTQGHQDILVETRSLPTHGADLEQVPVAGPAGPVPLQALARIVRAPMPVHHAVLLDGRPSIALTVFKQPGASTLPVTRAVDKALADTLNQLPPGVHWVRTYSQGHLVHLIGTDLGRNLLVGAGLAVAVLFWILGAGRGIWMLALSIPVSLLTAVAGLYALGRSLDLMTLGALTVAVGLLADDAIIVLESVYHRWEQGDEHWEGIWRGFMDIA
ncbi:MAG: efflux RND transporter permease subunit, partial [Deltaproteobacteria bacterium]